MVYLPPTSRYCSEHATWESGAGVFEWQPTVRSGGDRQNGKCVCVCVGGGTWSKIRDQSLFTGRGGGAGGLQYRRGEACEVLPLQKVSAMLRRGTTSFEVVFTW